VHALKCSKNLDKTKNWRRWGVSIRFSHSGDWLLFTAHRATTIVYLIVNLALLKILFQEVIASNFIDRRHTNTSYVNSTLNTKCAVFSIQRSLRLWLTVSSYSAPRWYPQFFENIDCSRWWWTTTNVYVSRLFTDWTSKPSSKYFTQWTTTTEVHIEQETSRAFERVHIEQETSRALRTWEREIEHST